MNKQSIGIEPRFWSFIKRDNKSLFILSVCTIICLVTIIVLFLLDVYSLGTRSISTLAENVKNEDIVILISLGKVILFFQVAFLCVFLLVMGCNVIISILGLWYSLGILSWFFTKLIRQYASHIAVIDNKKTKTEIALVNKALWFGVLLLFLTVIVLIFTKNSLYSLLWLFVFSVVVLLGIMTLIYKDKWKSKNNRYLIPAFKIWISRASASSIVVSIFWLLFFLFINHFISNSVYALIANHVNQLWSNYETIANKLILNDPQLVHKVEILLENMYVSPDVFGGKFWDIFNQLDIGFLALLLVTLAYLFTLVPEWIDFLYSSHKKRLQSMYWLITGIIFAVVTWIVTNYVKDVIPEELRNASLILSFVIPFLVKKLINSIKPLNQWTCQLCGYSENASTAGICGHCGNPRPNKQTVIT
jgi:hypothetical protein